MLTSRIPAMMAALTRYIINMTVSTPPAKIPTHMAGFRILVASVHKPSSPNPDSGHPARTKGVDEPPCKRPNPSLYVNPMMVKKSPMPTLVASLMDRGIARASHWRMPKKASAKKTKPSTNVAVRAIA